MGHESFETTLRPIVYLDGKAKGWMPPAFLDTESKKTICSDLAKKAEGVGRKEASVKESFPCNEVRFSVYSIKDKSGPFLERFR
jgi:hypothetical protein